MDDSKISIHKKEADEYKGEEERRQHVRFPVCIAVSHSGASFDVCDYIINISAGGLFIMTDKPMSIGEEVGMQFYIPGSKMFMKMQGRVVWVNKENNNRYPRGMGIEFVNCSEDDKKALDDYLSAQRHLLDIEI